MLARTDAFGLSITQHSRLTRKNVEEYLTLYWQNNFIRHTDDLRVLQTVFEQAHSGNDEADLWGQF